MQARAWLTVDSFGPIGELVELGPGLVDRQVGVLAKLTLDETVRQAVVRITGPEDVLASVNGGDPRSIDDLVVWVSGRPWMTFTGPGPAALCVVILEIRALETFPCPPPIV